MSQTNTASSPSATAGGTNRVLDAATQNAFAKQLAALQIPGDPIVFANAYDVASAQILLKETRCKAIATASFAIAAAAWGLDDDEMSFQQNLAVIRSIAKVVAVPHDGKPLSCDVQDGYDDVATTVKEIIKAGAVGCNIEDVHCKETRRDRKLRSKEDAASRVRTARAAAVEMGVPDFCINARVDTLLYGGSVQDAIERGNAYFAAGATTAFVWGAQRGISRDEVTQLVKGLKGGLNVKMNLAEGALTVPELRQLGVARISVGPQLWKKAVAAYAQGVRDMYSQT